MFLRCAETWADHIVIADQCSTDGSREIAHQHKSVCLIDNASSAYDEGARQRLLLDAARQFDGRRIIVALDADELLSANYSASGEWDKVLHAAEGTILRFDWVNVLPGYETCWIPSGRIPFGFVDDGSPHSGRSIHSTRIPAPPGAPELALQDVKVLHYQYTDWQRMKAKQRWYQCWEVLNFPNKRPVSIYRQYHHMDARPTAQLHPLERSWLEGYERAGIDVKPQPPATTSHWDLQTLELIRAHGSRRFRRLDIWTVDWERMAQSECLPPVGSLADPRSRADKLIHRWLAMSQGRAHLARVKVAQQFIKLAGW